MPHLRATQVDLCFEIATAPTDRPGGITKVVNGVLGFKYLDARDLASFVDGIESLTGAETKESVPIGDADPHFTIGSCVITQKHLHNLTAWNRVPVETRKTSSAAESRPITSCATISGRATPTMS